jgi:uncharacterized protein with NRDE domain
MCLILLAWQVHPDYPLVLAANRDEFYARPTAPAQWWSGPPAILAGRDLEAGGTWLGVTRSGAFAALTNFRAPDQHRAGAPSRGQLVPQMLDETYGPAERLARLQAQAPRYNGFNLLWAEHGQLIAYESVPQRTRRLGAGIYGLSNHLLDTPWPKVEQAKSRLADALTALPEERALLGLLRDEAPAPDEQLPRTGVSLAWERLLSSAFIHAPDYGTRCSTILTLSRGGELNFRERSWDALGQPAGEVQHSFNASL